jgi:hypothetical protein
MQILASAPQLASNSMSNAEEISAEAQHVVPTFEQMLSNVRNDNASAPPYELPTYEVAVAGTHRIVAQASLNDQPYYFPSWSGPLSDKDKFIGQLEAGKWSNLSAAITGLAESPMAMDAGMSAKVVEPAVRAIATWTKMLGELPPTVNPGDPYWQLMDKTNTAALKELALLYKVLVSRAGTMKPYNPSYHEHFKDLAIEIKGFALARKPVSNEQFQRDKQWLSETMSSEAENVG